MTKKQTIFLAKPGLHLEVIECLLDALEMVGYQVVLIDLIDEFVTSPAQTDAIGLIASWEFTFEENAPAEAMQLIRGKIPIVCLVPARFYYLRCVARRILSTANQWPIYGNCSRVTHSGCRAKSDSLCDNHQCPSASSLCVDRDQKRGASLSE